MGFINYIPSTSLLEAQVTGNVHSGLVPVAAVTDTRLAGLRQHKSIHPP